MAALVLSQEAQNCNLHFCLYRGTTEALPLSLALFGLVALFDFEGQAIGSALISLELNDPVLFLPLLL